MWERFNLFLCTTHIHSTENHSKTSLRKISEAVLGYIWSDARTFFFLADLSYWWKVKVPQVSLFNHSTHSLRQQRCLSGMFTSHDESLHRVWESCDYLITSSWQDGHFNTSHDLLCLYLNLISNDFYTISYGHIKCWGK